MNNKKNLLFFAANASAGIILWAVCAVFARPASSFFFAYALTFVVFLIAGREFKSMLTTMVFSYAYMVVLEFLQRAGWILGTFRRWDLLAEAAGCAAAGLLMLLYLKSRREVRGKGF